MDKIYKELGVKVEKLLREVNNVIDDAPLNDSEDKHLYKRAEAMQEFLENYVNRLEYFNKKATEGTLRQEDNGRFSLNDTELTCGYSLELFNEEEEEWNIGRVEHSSQMGGYYFYNLDNSNITLENGMLARIRE